MICIRIEQVCLIINRGNEGVEVVFPSEGHGLKALAGHEFEGLVDLVVRDNGDPVQRTLTGLPDRRWVPNLDDVTNELVAPKSREELLRLDGVQAILALTGGHFVTGPPTLTPDKRDYGKSFWKHGGWTGQMTNWVEWYCHAAPGHTYTLEKDGAEFIRLKDGVTLELANADTTSTHPGGPTVFADDFNLVYTFVNRRGNDVVRPSTATVKPEKKPTTQGVKLPLCPVGQV